jgi:hypothetical protein
MELLAFGNQDTSIDASWMETKIYSSVPMPPNAGGVKWCRQNQYPRIDEKNGDESSCPSWARRLWNVACTDIVRCLVFI